LHARLVERLTAEGAKAIVFDILFTDAGPDPVADERLARAIKESGRVILCGNFVKAGDDVGFRANGRNSVRTLSAGLSGMGNDNFDLDPDYAVDTFFDNVREPSGETNILWLPWAVAVFGGAPSSNLNPNAGVQRWVNYYGPPEPSLAAAISKRSSPKACRQTFSKTKSYSSARNCRRLLG